MILTDIRTVFYNYLRSCDLTLISSVRLREPLRNHIMARTTRIIRLVILVFGKGIL